MTLFWHKPLCFFNLNANFSALEQLAFQSKPVRSVSNQVTSSFVVIQRPRARFSKLSRRKYRSDNLEGANFSNLSVNNGPVKLFCFPFQMGVSKVSKVLKISW